MFKLSKVVHFFIFTAVCGLALSYSNLYLFHIAMGIMFFTMFATAAKKKQIMIKAMPTNFHYFFAFMFAYSILTMVWTISFTSTLTHLFYLFCGGVLALTIIYQGDSEESLTPIFKVAAFAFVLEIFICLLEIYTSFRMPVSPYSTHVRQFGRNTIHDLYFSTVKQDAVPTGFQWNPNNLATTMSMIFPFFLFHRNSWVKWLGVISIILIVNETHSRGNLLTLLFMILVSLMLYNKRKLLLVIPILYSLYLLTPYTLEFLENNFYNSSLGVGITESVSALNTALTGEDHTGDSVGLRTTLIMDGLNALKDTYGLGIGGGSSHMIHDIPLHNYWVETLVEEGVIFFLLFTIWYVKVTLKLLLISYRTRNETLLYFSSASSVAMIGFIPGAISPSSTIYLLPMWLMFGFAIAVINIHAKSDKNQQSMLVNEAA